MITQPFEIDLTGKSLDEVKNLLTDKGFTVSASKTSMWHERDKALGGTGKGPDVHILWLEDEECPFLTVTIFNGKQITLEVGMDLHLFDREPNQPAGQDWSAVRTLDIMA